MKYIVYLTMNTLNNKIYVGVHGTELDGFDNYLGCGCYATKPSSYENPKTPFQFALRKYGVKFFKRSTIQEFETLQEALDLEESIVNEEFISRTDTYNIALGGGYPPILNKVIYQYSLEGVFIKEWNTIVSAANYLNCSESCVGKAVLHKTTSNSYLWTDYRVDKLNIEQFNVYSPEKIIYQYGEFGEFIRSFNSISETSRFFNVNIANIQRSLKGGYRTQGNYFSFELLPKYIINEVKRNTGEIHKYSLDGTYIVSYNNMKELSLEFGCGMSGINSSIRLGGQHKGFQWSFEKVNKMKPLEKSKSSAKKIGQYTIKGELIKEYNTVRECRKDFANVSKVLKGLASHCKGFMFKYIE